MYEIYTVKQGDSIESIAKKLEVDADLLRSINGISVGFVLTPDMQIVVPKVKTAMFDYYTVQKGDTLYKISNLYNTNPEIVAALNGLNLNDYIYENQTILVPKPDVRLYITKQGDTISSVAQQLQVNQTSLINQNESIYLLPDQLIVYRER